MKENIYPQSNQANPPEQPILESLKEFLHVDPVKAPTTLKKFIEVAIQQGSRFYFRNFRKREIEVFAETIFANAIQEIHRILLANPNCSGETYYEILHRCIEDTDRIIEEKIIDVITKKSN